VESWCGGTGPFCTARERKEDKEWCSSMVEYILRRAVGCFQFDEDVRLRNCVHISTHGCSRPVAGSGKRGHGGGTRSVPGSPG
jgi:hypothetical protein